MKPRIYDKDFAYTKADATDIRKLFRRIREQQKLAAKVVPIKPKERKA